MQNLRDEAKSQEKSKLSGYGGASTGTSFTDKGSWGDAAEPVDSGQINRKPRGADDAAPVRSAACGGAVSAKRLDRKPRKAGGRVGFEGSKKDLEQDKKLAAKHKMPLDKFEKSFIDKKHDERESMEGLKKGGYAKRADGGGVFGSEDKPEPKTKGKATTVNVIINSGKPDIEGGMPMAPPPMIPPPPMMPPPGPPMTAGPPPGLGAMGGAPPMGLPGGGPGLPPSPLMRRKGGRISSPSDMTAGALSGEGRLEKIALQRASKR